MTDLVIFDCDGVLVDSEPITLTLIAERLTRAGLPIGHDEVEEYFVGRTLANIGDMARERGAEIDDTWVDRTYDALYERLSQGVELMPGVVDLLDRLEAAGIATAIASNGPMRKMEITLGGVGLRDRFKGRILSAYDFAAKPDPAMLRHAIEAAGATPERTAFIDDSAAGWGAAEAASVRGYAYLPAGDFDRASGYRVRPVRDMAEIADDLGL